MREGAGLPESETVSLWEATDSTPRHHDGRAPDLDVDVCVVGAGIAGLTTAYLLAREGRSVIVLDDGPVAGGMTQRTTAHLSSAIDDRYYEIERLHGRDGARLAAHSHAAAIDKIERIVGEEQIACDFERVDGYLFLGPDQVHDELEHELAAAQRAGLSVEPLPRVPMTEVNLGPCLRFFRQGQFHPLRYLHGLVRALLRDHGRIYTSTHVTSIAGGAVAEVGTAHGARITASHVVVATNTPINDAVVIHTKQAPYMTYVIAADVPRGSVPHSLAWDMLDPYHYIRLQALPDGAHDALIVGGEDHKTGQATDQAQRWDTLERWARERFPQMGEVRHRWSGQVMETVDGLAFIGRNPLDKPNVYVATGDSGMGMTHGTIAGMILCDMIQGRDNPWERLYDPSRKTLRALPTFAHENLNVARQYTEWLHSSATVTSADDIAPGHGAILQRGLRKIAAYRDEAGTLHEFSAVCRHLECVVKWNGAEHTWDCPCHGSRYDRLGRVINGPANSDLTPLRRG